MGWLRRDGELAERYRKMLRVPFGEYLPAFWQLPGISTLTHAVLGDYLRPVGAGDVHTRFAIDGMQVVPKICYETAFPEFIADAIGDEVSGAVLLFVSQDNWFGETSQPFQHRAISIMRAVENRVPMVHLINNGPSVAAAPSGRPLAGTPAFSLAELLVDLPYSVSAQASFYGRHAHLLGRLWLAMLAGWQSCWSGGRGVTPARQRFTALANLHAEYAAQRVSYLAASRCGRGVVLP